MNKNISLLAILTVAAIMTIGAVAPALANPVDEPQVARDKANEALDVACEKIQKEIDILTLLMDNGKEITFPEGLEELRNTVCFDIPRLLPPKV